MSNWNSPSNWSWKKAFEEHAKYVHQSDTTQQIINHLAGYPGESHGEFVKLSKDKQDNLYEILGQIL
tara:strand:- start:318 stop:518 length:201 start_codon:yes stop_codon:yes gene_type:complete